MTWAPGNVLLAVAGMLLLGAGAAKVVEPRRTVGALRTLGWPSSPRLVRAGAAAEALVGAAALVVGGPVVGVLVAASYVGFAVFVGVALRSGRPIGSCGCFGEADTPPSWHHVVLDLLLAVGGLAALGEAVPLVENPWVGVPAAGLAYAMFDMLARRPRWVGRAGRAGRAGQAETRQGAPHDRV